MRKSELIEMTVTAVVNDSGMSEFSKFDALRWLFAEYEEARAEEAIYEIRAEAEQGIR